jgi:AraC family transcriptional regulator
MPLGLVEAGRKPARAAGLEAETSLKIAVLEFPCEGFQHSADPCYLTLVKHCGGGRVWRNKESSPAEAGAIGMHSFEPSQYLFEEPAKVMQAHLPFALVGKVCESLFDRELARDQLWIRMGARDDRLSERMRAIHSGLEWSEPTNLLLDCWAVILADVVIRRFSSHSQQHAHASFGKIPSRGLAYVIDYIESHLDQDVRLDSLAAVAAMSTYHFARRFKETVGVSPHAYVMERRLRRAQEMLKRRGSELAHVAAACGFSNQGHLNAVFKRGFGVTPGAYHRSFR